MKTLIYNGNKNILYKAEKIIKNSDSIIGYNNGKEVFSFKGITDFSLFTLKDNEQFDIEKNIIDKLILDNINMQMQIDSLIEASLGGN